jgi:hypothetical protein
MPAKTKMQDVVVLLPGITGSSLQKDGKDVWAISGQAISSAIFSLAGSLDELLLKEDDPQSEDLGDGIQAARVMRDVTFFPKLAKIDGYTGLLGMITEMKAFRLCPASWEGIRLPTFLSFLTIGAATTVPPPASWST